MSTRKLRARDELAIHFRCDICGKIQPVEFINGDEMLKIITDYVSMQGKHVCGNCESRIGQIIESADFSQWEKEHGLRD